MKTTTREQDAALVARLVTDEPAAWREFIATYGPAMEARALQILHRREDAEEVALEAFLRVRTMLLRFRGDCSLGTLMMTIVRRGALNRWHYWRRRRRDVTFPISHEADDGGIPEALLGDDGCPVREQSEFGELSELVARAMGRLKAYHRRLLEQVAAGSSYIEIARNEGIEFGTVKSRISRARARLRREMAALSGDRRAAA